MQKRGIPAVTLVTEQFVRLADATRKGLGLPDMPLVVLPSNVEYITEGELRKVADRTIREALDALVKDDGRPQGADA